MPYQNEATSSATVLYTIVRLSVFPRANFCLRQELTELVEPETVDDVDDLSSSVTAACLLLLISRDFVSVAGVSFSNATARGELHSPSLPLPYFPDAVESPVADATATIPLQSAAAMLNEETRLVRETRGRLTGRLLARACRSAPKLLPTGSRPDIESTNGAEVPTKMPLLILAALLLLLTGRLTVLMTVRRRPTVSGRISSYRSTPRG